MKTKKMTIIALLIALSAVGSYITIFMSIALDSLPGFFAALALGALAGGLVGGVGHFLTALVHGFPLGLPTHLLLMAMMFLACYLLGYYYQKRPFLAIALAFLVNWLLALFLSSLLSYAMGLVPSALFLLPLMIFPLFLGTAFNLFPALILFKSLGGVLNEIS